MPYSRITRTAYGADAIQYARGHGKGHNGYERRSLCSAGVNMLPDKAIRFERQMQPVWNHMDARHKIQVDRCVVSFSTKELDLYKPEDQLKALEIGCKIAKRNAPECQSAIFVHADGKGHKLHLHILTNDVKFKDYRGLESEAYYHPRFRRIVDEVCKDYFELDRAEKPRERVTQAERGRRTRNEQIRRYNEIEEAAAAREGRTSLPELEKYIWKDDLRKRIKEAAAKAIDENSFAHELRMNGVELLEQEQKDGTVTYVHHVTRTMPEHYVYELFDTSGFVFEPKIPRNLRSRSHKLGADYGPEGVRAMFRKAPEAAREKPAAKIDVPGIIASAKKPEPEAKPVRKALTPKEKDRLELEKAIALAKRYVSPIVKEAYPDADEEWEEQLYDRFISRRDTRRAEAEKNGRKIPPIYRKDANGEGQINGDQLEKQYREFLEEWKASEAAKELERVQKARMAMAADIMRTVEKMRKERQEQQDDRGAWR